MNTRGTYIELGDGFEFVLNRRIEHTQHGIIFSASAVYDLDNEKWVKYRNTFHDDACIQYQFRSMEESERRKTFDDVPVIDYDKLAELGYMIHLGESAAHLYNFRFNMREFGKRRRLFVEKMKLLPTVINLGVDEEMKEIVGHYLERDRQTALEVKAEIQQQRGNEE